MDDRNDGEPDGSPFFVFPEKGGGSTPCCRPLIHDNRMLAERAFYCLHNCKNVRAVNSGESPFILMVETALTLRDPLRAVIFFPTAPHKADQCRATYTQGG